MTPRTLARGVISPRAAAGAPDGFFEVVHEGMRQPGFRTAMLTHMRLAMRFGRPRAENFLSDAQPRQLKVPVLMIWGDEDSTAAHKSASARVASSLTGAPRSSQAGTPPSSTTPRAAAH